MANNKFLAFLHKNTNKFTLILIYTLLEWILIILLLSNSLFSYLIIKFTDYFGLKKPCPLCSRIDHVLEPGKSHKFYKEILCESHSREFAECSCRGLKLEKEDYSPCIVIKPSLDILDYNENENFVRETEGKEDQFNNFDVDLLPYSTDRFEVQEEIEKRGEIPIIAEDNLKEKLNYSVLGLKIEAKDYNFMIRDPSFGDNLDQFGDEKDLSAEIVSPHLEFFVGQGGYSLIPIQLMDSKTEENQSKDKRDDNCENFGENFDFLIEENDESLNFHPRDSDFSRVCLESEKEEDDNDKTNWEPNVLEAKEEQLKIIATEPEAEAEAEADSEADGEAEAEVDTEAEADGEAEAEVDTEAEADAEAEVSIGTEIPDLDEMYEIQDEANFLIGTSLDSGSSTSLNFHQHEINGVSQDEEEIKELNAISIHLANNVAKFKVSNGSELSDIEEDKIPDTPTSTDSFLHLHEKLLMLGKRESGAEDSLDGSVVYEVEGSDELKVALKAERKALETLYAELEEERSASATAANESMAMITRLQEEKAAMQMESLQYQRMIEEQSEYDQEALQLLNELLVKREKENQELQRELEIYRNKEKFRLLRINNSGGSESFSGTSSNNGDSFGLSIDLNKETKENGSLEHVNGEHSTPVDEVLDLDESLGNLEEERNSILEQLKNLEEKILIMSDEDEPISHFYEENIKHQNGVENGFHRKTNGNLDPEGRIKGVKGKRLLPLFDEIENGHDVNGYHSHEFENSNIGNIRNEIEEEFDTLYGRVQALEEDNEFLKHCISSLKKGDKGLDLLQEILQHMRDLRNVELGVTNLADPFLV